MELVTYGKYYHIFNCGTNKQNIFLNTDDYIHFFNLMSIYLEPIAEIFAYAALKNHFHLAIRTKEVNEIGFLDPKYTESKELDKKWKTLFPENEDEKNLFDLNKKPNPDKMIQHFCSTYAKGFNNKYKRSGAVFEHTYHRIEVDNEQYFKRLILYIHNNPVKHGFCNRAAHYPWTSYFSLISLKPTKLSREKVLGYFDNHANFISKHKPDDNFEDIDFLFLEW